MITDTVSDMLIRIKNGYQAKKDTVKISFSNFNVNLARLLAKEGYISGVLENKDNRTLELDLKYQDNEPVITGLVRISKPGLRVYKGKNELPRVLGGMGTAIISTPQGLMTEKEARKKGLGGEVICKIW